MLKVKESSSLQKNNTSSSASGRDKFSVFVKGGIQFLNLKNSLFNKIDFVFVSNAAFRQEVLGTYYDRFCDLFLDYFSAVNQHSALLLEFKRQNVEYKLPRSFSKSVKPADSAINFFRAINNKFRKKKSRKAFLPEYEKFIEEIQEILGVNAANFFTKKWVVNMAEQADLTANFYQNLFKKGKPKAVFTISYYSPQSRGAILAASRLGIPSIDIQHGVQGQMHESYGRWANVPVKGYNLLPTIFWNWDQPSFEAIEQWALPTIHKPYIGGNPWLSFWNLKKFNAQYNADYLLSGVKGRKIILYSLQPSFEAFPALIKEAISRTRDEFVWWIRIHPRQRHQFEEMQQEAFKIEENQNINIKEASELPLPLLLNYTNFHITYYSTVAIEAANYNVPTLFLNDLGKLYYEEQLASSGLGYFDIHTVNDLISVLCIEQKGVRVEIEEDASSIDEKIINLIKLVEDINNTVKP
ncbi:hypothetical protein [Rufibacter quisquiliarum]|nr:hypothetical protein [Rufibacter quisquiliarum]